MGIHEKAALLYGAFEGRQRDNGARFRCLKDGSPAWMSEVIHAAHGDQFLPDDWRYDAIETLASHIADAGDLDDARHEAVDGAVDIYTSRLTAWLASHLSRVDYCDDAAAEYGFDKERGTIGLLQAGQYAELDEIWGLLVSALEAADVGDDADD